MNAEEKLAAVRSRLVETIDLIDGESEPPPPPPPSGDTPYGGFRWVCLGGNGLFPWAAAE